MIIMKVIPITEARQNIYKLVEDAISFSEPVQITSKKGNVVLVSEEDWRAIQETLYLLSVPGLRESIQAAENTPIEEMKTLEDLGWDLD
jgi:prevent-host-death family protein